MRTVIVLVVAIFYAAVGLSQEGLKLNSDNYFSSPFSSVLFFNDSYSEGHQGGIQLILHGERLAANGDLRLEAAPGQWDPFPQVNNITSNSDNEEIRVSLSFPNEKAANRKFNRIYYPNLELDYEIVVSPEGESFRIIVNLEKDLPKEWLGKVGFNLELFPGAFFGKHYYMDGKAGLFPRQLTGSIANTDNEKQIVPFASGKKLIIAPDDPQKRIKIESTSTDLELLDGRAIHSNGWFIVRSVIPKGSKGKAIEWLITPSVDKSWHYGPVIHHNQVGYLPGQKKTALIECDPRCEKKPLVQLVHQQADGEQKIVMSDSAKYWGMYLRYNYYNFDFSTIRKEGIYFIQCGDSRSESFLISSGSYDQGVWQPGLEYFLPVQMCHMKVIDRYRVWHGLCHMDDARMAPSDSIHFDGYWQGESNYTQYSEGEFVTGLNIGGWHDAGDYDLRIESQGSTVHTLSLIQENFAPKLDNSSVNQLTLETELHKPDGKPDILQQIEHGTLHIVSAFQSLGRLPRGVICNDLRQYVLLGDGSVMTDNLSYKAQSDLPEWLGNKNDDRWIFTEDNPRRELQLCAHLAAASRALSNYNDTLAEQALNISKILWTENANSEYRAEKAIALSELYLTTEDPTFLNDILLLKDFISSNIHSTGWAVVRILESIEDQEFRFYFTQGVQDYYIKLRQEANANPIGVPLNAGVWGSAWNVEHFGMQQYFFHKYLQSVEAAEYLQTALNYLLGLHTGSYTGSFVSGVGVQSPLVAYGVNRADWSYIPGGVISGTATILPDFPELKEWPFLWQQTEYMVGGAASKFMFIVLGVLEVN